MKPEDKRKLLEQIHHGLSRVHIAGVKGEKLHGIIRYMATKLESKHAHNDEKHIDADMAHLEEAIKGHLIRHAQDDEKHIITELVHAFEMMYSLIHSTALYKKHDLEEIQAIEAALIKLKVKDPKIRKFFEGIVNAWKADVKQQRETINATYARAEGGHGFRNVMTDVVKTEGYMKYFGEYRLVRDIRKTDSSVEHMVAEIKKHPDLKKLLERLQVLEDKLHKDFAKFDKLVFTSWDALNKKIYEFLQIIARAVGIHELPAQDDKDVKDLTHEIVQRLEVAYLHNLRIVDVQLEGEIKQTAALAKRLG
ncbi:hypothetical protein HN587_04575 [Candidatus Woesearchaeota archaeon]|jgi:hypothetical protein|nr:hypothetical protein [Candidatus Woesearchaeota archaeon]